ncbi:MAG TPA: DNA double-strand break repair nuclease NurA [Anaerolineae bacterium]|nr:DNA double-strand break repair nuclease NurA [Anaerolineae bacterium]
MTLEFQKLAQDIEKMAGRVAQHRHQRAQDALTARQTLQKYTQDWPAIARALHKAETQADPKHYRGARPLNDLEPLATPVPPPTPPAQATIIATDGSQIMPDRHAAFLYYLINIGGIIYHHGRPTSPTIFSLPEIHYLEYNSAATSQSAINIERDLKEISHLARTVWENRDAQSPLLAILDQRLLYWPIGGHESASQKAVAAWGDEMSAIHHSGGLLAGYIVRPGKTSVITLLQALAAQPTFDWLTLGQRQAGWGLSDADLYADILPPGHRSPVFVDISPANERFTEQDPHNTVCFFYFNPGQFGTQIARVDIPLWVADDPDQVALLHALLYDQCRILGDYPYVLARADEMAVVGKQDQAELNFMLDLAMQRQGVHDDLTAKQASKDLARGARTRHLGP